MAHAVTPFLMFQGADRAGRPHRVRPLICFDSPAEHPFTFTPLLPLFVECESEAELDRAFDLLSDGGEVLTPADDFGFARKFAWVSDRFGLSWQLDLL